LVFGSPRSVSTDLRLWTMARYKVILAYDGTHFAGSQRQARARSVQGELERVLRDLGWTGRAILMAGRTDAGVHAEGQTAAFDLEWPHADADLLHALNAALPRDLALKSVHGAPPEFHPRYDARARRYRYRLHCSPLRDPLRERYSWRVWPEVSGQALDLIARVLVGRHDFAALGTATSKDGTTVRTVSASSWSSVDDEWHYTVTADAFLYRMVRRMVFVQVAVAQGRSSTAAVAAALADARGAASGLPAGLAPAHGLTLAEITY
jgi:tRNA pseudouridine38-40 synthase